MEFLNSVTATVLAGALVQANGLPTWLTASVPAWLAASVLTGLAALILQFVWVKRKYESAKALWEAPHGYAD